VIFKVISAVTVKLCLEVFVINLLLDIFTVVR